VNTGGVTAFDGARLHAARKDAKLTQEQLAEALLAARPDSPAAAGRTTTLAQLRRATRDFEQMRIQVIGYEKGSAKPHPSRLGHLAAAVGVDAAALLDPAATWTLSLLRSCRGHLQSEVAQGIGVSRATYSNVERGAAVLDTQTQQKLALLLEVTPAELTEAMEASTTVAAVLAHRRSPGRRSGTARAGRSS
jgi:transcriptional regulator with XRE-family HTH domain